MIKVWVRCGPIEQGLNDAKAYMLDSDRIPERTPRAMYQDGWDLINITQAEWDVISVMGRHHGFVWLVV